MTTPLTKDVPELKQQLMKQSNMKSLLYLLKDPSAIWQPNAMAYEKKTWVPASIQIYKISS